MFDMAIANFSSVVTVDATTEEGKKCAFPFMYDGKYYGECMVTSTKPWCATTADYDKDKEWGYCV